MLKTLKTGFAYMLLCLGLLACRPAPEPPPTQILHVTATNQVVQATEISLPTQAAVSIVHALPVLSCTAASELPVYTVIAGDTLYNIATRAEMTLVELRDANCLPLGETRLEVRQRLYVRNLPEPLPITTIIPFTEMMPPVITVVPTMFTLTPGQPTAIQPTPTPVVTSTAAGGNGYPPTATSAPTIVSCVPRADWPVYSVVAGDTLYSIATRAGMTMAELQDANCTPRSSTVIFIGQRLYVRLLPAPPATPTP